MDIKNCYYYNNASLYLFSLFKLSNQRQHLRHMLFNIYSFIIKLLELLQNNTKMSVIKLPFETCLLLQDVIKKRINKGNKN